MPGPNGLPGSYPIRLSEEGAELVLFGISKKDAIDINEMGAKLDGIEQLKNDGTVGFLEENVKNMRVVVGYECEEPKSSESEERAQKLKQLLMKLYEKYNVEVYMLASLRSLVFRVSLLCIF